MEPTPKVQAPNGAVHLTTSSTTTSGTLSNGSSSVKTDSDRSDHTPDTEISTPLRKCSSDKPDAPESKLKKVKKKDNAGTSETAQPRLDDDSDCPSDTMRREVYLSALSQGPQLKERRAKAHRRLLQSQQHTQLVNDRLAALETDVNILMKRDPEDGNAKGPTGPKHKVETQYLSWVDFKATAFVFENGTKQTKHVPEIDQTSKTILEVLIKDSEDNVRRRVQNPNTGSLSSTTDPKQNGKTSYSICSESAPIDSGSISGIPERLRIRSPLLVKTLEEISKAGPLSGIHKHKTVLLRPFKLLVHYASEIRERQLVLERKAQDETGDDEALQHVNLLVDFIDRDLAPVWELRDNLKAGKLQKVTFPDLWHLFKYGQEVRTPGNKQLQLYKVLRFTGGRELMSTADRAPNPADRPSNHASEKLKTEGYSSGAFIIDCCYFDFDGTQYGPVNKTFQIRRFEGEKDISSLPVYPLICDPKQDKTREALLARGKKFATLSGSSTTAHKQYTGLTLDKQQEQVDSQVIIDFQLAFITKSENKPTIGISNLISHDSRETTEESSNLGSCRSEGCCGNDYIYRDYVIDLQQGSEFMKENKRHLEPVENADDLNEDQKVLLPNRVFGFILRSRRWATFDINLIEGVQYTNNGWANLVIPDHIKETVLALVENHARGRVQHENQKSAPLSVDLVRGKGKGLIILLHGEPGVGKTSTAECVADHTKRPLFPITCGDIGDNAEKVEENLEKNFQLAHKWGCVLLLDEADIFLQKRSSTAMTRNGIVSVFLRSLEYYSGILFLTTNRVGTIDEAFKSRIHVSLFYPKLDRKTTLKIWETNLSRVKADIEGAGRRVKYNEKDILQFAKTHFRELKNMDLKSWNGRQIRNAFQTVVALADYKSKGSTLILHRSHFEKVAEASKEFDEYLTEVYQGQTESKRAERERSRFDDYPDRPRGDLPPAYTTQRRTGAATRRRRAKPTKEETDNDTDESDESDESVHESDISSECSEDEPAKPAKTRSRGKQKRTSPEESETTSNNNNDDDDDDDDDGDDDKQPAVAKMSKNKKTKSGLGKKASRK